MFVADTSLQSRDTAMVTLSAASSPVQAPVKSGHGTKSFMRRHATMLRKPPIRAVHKSGTRLGLSLVQQTGVHRQRRGAYARLANVPASKTHSALVGIL